MISRRVNLILAHRIYLLVAVHIVLAACVYQLAFLLRFDFKVPVDVRIVREITLPLVVVVKLFAFHQFGSMHGWWRYVTFEDLAALLKVATLATLAITAIDHFFLGGIQIPRTVLALDWCLTVLVIWWNAFDVATVSRRNMGQTSSEIWKGIAPSHR